MKSLKAGKLAAGAFLGACMLISGQMGCAASQPAQTQAQGRFVEMDLNKDGKVVLEEFQTAFPNMSENAFTIIDKNGDKGIDQVEWIEFTQNHARPDAEKGAPMNNIPGDPLIPPPDSSDLPLMQPPVIN